KARFGLVHGRFPLGGSARLAMAAFNAKEGTERLAPTHPIYMRTARAICGPACRTGCGDGNRARRDAMRWRAARTESMGWPKTTAARSGLARTAESVASLMAKPSRTHFQVRCSNFRPQSCFAIATAACGLARRTRE